MIWYFGCILFCIHCLSLHLSERSAMSYSSVDRNESFNILACLPLSNLVGEKQIDLDQLNETVNLFFSKSNRFAKLRKVRADEMESEIFSQIRHKNYLLLGGRFCLIRNGKLSILLEKNGFQRLGLSYVAFKSDTLDFLKLPSFEFTVGHLIVVIRDEHPFCNYSKVRCLNDCFKRGQKLSRYYYEGNESGLVLLQYDEQNQAMIKHEHDCFEQCKRDSCKLVYFRMSRTSFWGSNSTRTIVTKAYRLTSDSEFIIQFIGLISFFVNNSLAQLLLKPVRLVISKLQRAKRFAMFYVPFKKIVLFATLNYCAILYAQMIAHHIDRLDYPIRKETTSTLTHPEAISLAICVDVDSVSEVGLL